MGSEVTGSTFLSLEVAALTLPFASSLRPFFAFFVFFFFSFEIHSQPGQVSCWGIDYLLPAPHRPEAIKEPHIFKQIWV